MSEFTLQPDYNLDVAGAQQLEAEISAIDLDTVDGEVRLDLSGVAFVASSGLRVMLKHAQAMSERGIDLVIASPNDTVREVLSMSGFDTIIRVE